MARTTLVLNASYEPHSIVSWQTAIKLWFADKVEIVEEYEDFDLKSVSFTMKCPAVVRLLKYVSVKNRATKFSRMNVFGRDNFTCQYCGCQPGTMELTFDHVVPRSRGGKTCWDNIVTACIDCNSRKADKTPAEAKMRLKKEPKVPTDSAHSFRFSMPKTPDAWRNWLYWNQELSSD